MVRHKSDSRAEERSVALKKRKRWPRPTFRFLRALGRGRNSETPVPSEAVPQAAEEEVRTHFGAILEVLLDKKAKDIGSMIDEMTQIRIPTLRKEDVSVTASDYNPTGHPISSSTSSGEDLAIYRQLERNESSLLAREFTHSLERKSRGMGESATKQQQQPPQSHQEQDRQRQLTARSRARHVQSETNEELPQAGPTPTPVLQLPLDSIGVSSILDSHLQDNPAMASGSSYPMLTMPMVEFDELTVMEELGRGQFASVKYTLWKGIEVALKEWHTLRDDESMEMAFQEGRSLACLRHPCVVSFYGMLNNGPSPGLVVEYLPHLSLKSRLTQLKGTDLDTKQLKVAVALRAARGMEFLHSRKVIHFDLKCENLLCDLRDPASPIVKIGDVGLSKEKMKTFVSGNMRGTLPWMAPELFPNVQHVGAEGNITDLVNEKVDVYSFGVVLWEIWEMGEMPYPDLSPADLLEGIWQGSLRLESPCDCDEIWADVMRQCLHRSPDKRPDFSTIISQLEWLLK